MKKLFYAAFIFLMLFSFSSLAQAQSDTKGIYVGLIGGYVIPHDMPTFWQNLTNPLDTADFDVSLKNGYLLGTKVGWLTPFTNRIMAVEFEYNHISHDMDRIDNFFGDELTLDGKTTIDLFMINLLGRYPNGRFHPYAGFGLGYAYIKIDDMWAKNLYGTYRFMTFGGSEGVFAYQLMAGIDFDITKNFIIGLGYKYLDPMKISYDTTYQRPDGGGGIITIPTNAETDYSSHNFTLSLSFMF